jgi:hypothetical protein
MRKPRSRQRRVTITDELVALFRAALPHEMARDRKLTDEGFAAIQAFNLAVGVRPWERSPLDPIGDHPAQAPLVAKLDATESAAWERYARKCRKEHDRFQAEYDAATRRAAERVRSALAR